MPRSSDCPIGSAPIPVLAHLNEPWPNRAGRRINPHGFCLYGLYTLLRLHFLQEEENYFTLAEDAVKRLSA